MYPPKKGYPKSCVRYLELTTHKTPFLPHRYELDQTSTTFFQHKENTSAIHKFGVLSSNIRLLFNGHRWRNRVKRFRGDEKKEGGGRNRYRKHFDTTLICKLSTPSPDKFVCYTHRIGRSKDRRDSRRRGGGTRGGKSLDTGRNQVLQFIKRCRETVCPISISRGWISKFLLHEDLELRL